MSQPTPDPAEPDPGHAEESAPPEGTAPPEDPAPPGPGRAEEPVGGLGEEAVKLLFALRDLTGDLSGDLSGDPSGDPAGHPVGDAAEAAAEAAAAAMRSAASSARRIGEHVGGSESCRYCPVCQTISLVRATPPEVRHHLVAAGTSLLRAVSSLMATPLPDDANPDPSARAQWQPPAGPQPNRDDEWEDI
jgi:hypothetical protein